MRPVCNCSFILYFQQDVKFDGLCGGYCFWKIKCKKMLHSTSQERTQEGQLTRLNPISGEDSGHTSILCQERTVDTPQSYVRRGQWTHLNPSQERTVNTGYLHIRRGHTSILGRETSRSLDSPSVSRTPSLQASKS